MRNEAIIVTLPDKRQMRVLVCDIRSDRVRLGFEAPADVVIHRTEIQEAVDREKARAACVVTEGESE